MKTPDMSLVLVGAGNVAMALGPALQQAGYPIRQVYSRSEASAGTLAGELNVPFTVSPQEIVDDADGYVFSLKDDALVSVLSRMRRPKHGIYIHTAGSLPADVFEPYVSRYGVLYPLQTFSKGRAVSFSEVPLFVEAGTPDDEQLLLQLARSLSRNVRLLAGEKRRYLHLAAVFACNFTNHMYTLASDVLTEQSLEFDWLLPLIRETARKVETLSPAEAQTGPAVRYDESVMDKHLQLLTDENRRDVYRLISRSIHLHSENENKKTDQ